MFAGICMYLCKCGCACVCLHGSHGDSVNKLYHNLLTLVVITSKPPVTITLWLHSRLAAAGCIRVTICTNLIRTSTKCSIRVNHIWRINIKQRAS